MRISFLEPLWLLALLSLPLAWLGLRRVPLAQRSVRRAAAAIRTLLVLCLILALAGTQIVQAANDTTVVFLVDASDSMAPAQREQALAFINEALQHRPIDDRAAVIMFGKNALIERLPDNLQRFDRVLTVPEPSRTNIADALRLSMALFPSGSRKRIVLLSDGAENSDNAREAARLAGLRNIPIDIVPLPVDTTHDVIVRTLDAPDTVRENQTVTLHAAIDSTIKTRGKLEVFADGVLVGTETVDIPIGTTIVPLEVPGSSAGFHRYEVRVEAEGDNQAANNRAATFTTVAGPPQVLLITNDAKRIASLSAALRANGARVEIAAPNAVSALPAQLQTYAAIVLDNVASRDVPTALQTALLTYVHEQGGSLMMIGGRDSFGAGGWRRSPITRALPVDLDPPSKLQRPDVALVLVLDHSGSMAEETNGVTKIDLAKEAVYQASLGLEQSDNLGLVIFDDTAEWILQPQTLPDITKIEESLQQFSPAGGTDILSGIQAAADALPAINAKLKHVILLTDGLADDNYSATIDRMRANGITISIVSIGGDANPNMRAIAERGGGRFYPAERISEIPKIFLAETVLVAGRDIVETPFTPQVVLPGPVVRDFPTFPQLYGYNATEARPAARVFLATPDGKPVLAQWQYGLGRGIAWTSDLTEQWGRDWVGWGDFNHFSAGLLDLLLPPTGDSTLELQSDMQGGQAILNLSVRDTGNQPIPQAQVEGRILDPNNQPTTIPFIQVAPGQYRAVVPADQAGVYLAQIQARDAKGNVLGSLSRGLAASYSPEYSTHLQDSQLLSDLAHASGGNAHIPAQDVFLPPAQFVGTAHDLSLSLIWLALALLPLDIAVRRLRLRPVEALGLLGGAFGRLFPARQRVTMDDAQIDRLQAARNRVRRSVTATQAGIPERSPATPPAVPPASQPIEVSQVPTSAASIAPVARQVEPTQAASASAPSPVDEATLARLLSARRRSRPSSNASPHEEPPK